MTAREGEQLIIRFLEHAGALVTDLTNEPEFWAQDIDLIAQKGDKTTKIEVKTDTRISSTKNFFIEIENPRSNGGEGWFCFTKADLLYYLDSQNLIVYIFKMDRLKDFIERNQKYLEKKYVYDGAVGFLIPLSIAPFHSALYIQEDLLNA